MDTEQELKQRHESENETPELDDDGDGGVAGQIPTPSIERKHLLAIGAIVAIVLAIYLYRQGDGSNGSLDDVTGEIETEATVEDEDDEIHVPQKNSDPLAGDEAIIEEFREREIIGGDDE